MGSTGISYRGSEVKISDITDGTSTTYMLGEKSIDIDEYNTGWSTGDDQCAYVGWDNDNHRTTLVSFGGLLYPPMRDEAGIDIDCIYGNRRTSTASTWPSATGRCE